MLPSTHWACPSPDLFQNLSPGVVHVWRVPLEDSPMQAARYRPELSADERARAERFCVPRFQDHFVTARGILRRLLSRYVGMPATSLRIENNRRGKPALAGLTDFRLEFFEFNVSHTVGMALLAVTVDQAIGIDVERTDRPINAQDIAARYFSPRESSFLRSLSPEQQAQTFLTYWTCKEAYLKMRGIGLSGGLAQCEIILDSDGVNAHVSLPNEPSLENKCSLFRIHAGPGHIGALAVEWPSVQVSFWEWKD